MNKKKKQQVKRRGTYAYLRVIAAWAVMAVFAGAFLQSVHLAQSGRGEFGPTVLRSLTGGGVAALSILAGLLVLTAVFGRFYCAFLCPLGILQDALWRVRNYLAPRRFRRAPVLGNHPHVRYGVLIGTAFALAFGGGWLIGLIEPFSFFGRICNGVFAPAVCAGYNIVRGWADWLDWGPLTPRPFDWRLTALTGCAFAVLTAAVVLRNRIFCNTLCPAGALLGLLGRGAYFRFSIGENCTRCGMCARECKGGCIDLRDETIDNERCLMCGNCLAVCRSGAIGYRHERGGAAAGCDASRREFFGAMSLAALAGAVAGRTIHRENVSADAALPVMPPGALSLDQFNARCTGCQLCVANCRGHVLKPAWGEYGLAGVGQAVLDFTRGMCEYDCNNCSQVCPTGALEPLASVVKRRRKIGEVRYIKKHCIVVVHQCDCGACAEHCPTGALKMIPYGDNLRIPSVVADLCIGCGCCENVCPAHPEKAVKVHGLAIQGVAADPAKASKPVKKTGTLEEFPF